MNYCAIVADAKEPIAETLKDKNRLKSKRNMIRVMLDVDRYKRVLFQTRIRMRRKRARDKQWEWDPVALRAIVPADVQALRDERKRKREERQERRVRRRRRAGRSPSRGSAGRSPSGGSASPRGRTSTRAPLARRSRAFRSPGRHRGMSRSAARRVELIPVGELPDVKNVDIGALDSAVHDEHSKYSHLSHSDLLIELQLRDEQIKTLVSFSFCHLCVCVCACVFTCG